MSSRKSDITVLVLASITFLTSSITYFILMCLSSDIVSKLRVNMRTHTRGIQSDNSISSWGLLQHIHINIIYSFVYFGLFPSLNNRFNLYSADLNRVNLIK